MITQGRVSRSLLFDFLGKFNLKNYHNPNRPCVFFGCYPGRDDANVILAHRSLALLVWRGTDIMRLDRRIIKKIRSRSNIKHIAIGSFIEKDLKALKIPYRTYHITTTDAVADPRPLGNCVYTYVRNSFYNPGLVKEIARRIRYRIIVNDSPMTATLEHNAMASSFIGLRLTPHDGLPNTVLKLGLMGRRCIYNGDLPNAIPWRGIDDIIDSINKESDMIGQTNVALSNIICNYIEDDREWLNERIWI